MKFNLKNETNHLVDEIDYETYDIDEYICLWKVQHGWKYYFMNEKKICQHGWCGWKFMNIAEFNPHGEQYMVRFIAVIMHD